MSLLPLPGYPGFRYDPDASPPTIPGDSSPIVGPSGARLRTYRLGDRSKLYVKLDGTLVPLDNALPASPGEQWLVVYGADCAEDIYVSSEGRVRKGSASRSPRLLKQFLTARGASVRLEGRQVPVASLMAEVGFSVDESDLHVAPPA